MPHDALGFAQTLQTAEGKEPVEAKTAHCVGMDSDQMSGKPDLG